MTTKSPDPSVTQYRIRHRVQTYHSRPNLGTGKELSFGAKIAKEATAKFANSDREEAGLDDSFVEICRFLYKNEGCLSWRSKKTRPKVTRKADLLILAEKYFKGYRRTDFPAESSTIPDKMVSLVIEIAYDYSAEDCERIKVEHKHSMSAENCVGALLERYLDSVLRKKGWHWCCGDFVKSIDFIRKGKNGKYLALQIKNRDNTENSASKSVRSGTTIQKWFRSFSKKNGTNWENLPESMRGHGLSESDFVAFVEAYLKRKEGQLAK